MGLVDYSDSESDSEAPPPQQDTTSKAAPATKQLSSNPIARSSAGKILVSLPTAAATAGGGVPHGDEPPTKRARLGAGGPGGTRFSNFGSFLPPPKVTKPTASQAPKGSAPRPGVHLKTGAEPAFSREAGGFGDDADAADESAGSGWNLPPPKASSGPTIPEGQKPEEEVKLVGKPLMFRPLSVARKPTKKKRIVPGAVPVQPASTASTAAPSVPKQEAVAKKKISLFSMGDEEPSAPPAPSAGGAYEPLFGESTELEPTADNDEWTDQAYEQAGPGEPQQPDYPQAQGQSLSSIANDLNLSKRARRELFGRGGPSETGAKIVNFSMEREYEHNEALRASGEQQAYNPVRTIAPGKHNLKQLITAAQNNQSALEDSYAAGRSTKRDAGARYGWG